MLFLWTLQSEKQLSKQWVLENDDWSFIDLLPSLIFIFIIMLLHILWSSVCAFPLLSEHPPLFINRLCLSAIHSLYLKLMA